MRSLPEKLLLKPIGPRLFFEPWLFRFECQINIIIHYQIHFPLSIFGVLRLAQTDAEITAGTIFLGGLYLIELSPIEGVNMF